LQEVQKFHRVIGREVLQVDAKEDEGEGMHRVHPLELVRDQFRVRPIHELHLEHHRFQPLQ
jgi:hypothetical protein